MTAYSDLSAVARVNQIASEIWAETAAAAGFHDLTLRQAILLHAIGLNPEMSQTQLVEATSIDRSRLADIVKRLINRGLIQRSRLDHDARAYAVLLTDTGEDLVKRLTPVIKATTRSLNRRVRGLDKISIADRVMDAAE